MIEAKQLSLCGAWTIKAFMLLTCFGCGSAVAADHGGTYMIRADQPQQVIKGLGFEIQSDSIGSGHAGMPNEIVAVPHDLTPAEKVRFYQEMLHGFRYARLAMGLYLRGDDAEKKHIIERYPGQMDDLRSMQQISGIEGFDVEYWSPAPYWKQGMTYYGGSIRATDPAFLNAFSDAMIQDLKYLQGHGLRVVQWGLQNEPAIGLAKRKDQVHEPLNAQQSYASCHYTPEDYAAVLKVAAPKVRALLSNVQIHAPSWDGPAGPYAAEIRKDPELLKNIDGWTWHQIGHNSNDQIDLRDKYIRGADGKPVYQNEFEYQPWDTKKIASPFMNTGQALMNWMVFEKFADLVLAPRAEAGHQPGGGWLLPWILASGRYAAEQSPAKSTAGTLGVQPAELECNCWLLEISAVGFNATHCRRGQGRARPADPRLAQQGRQDWDCTFQPRRRGLYVSSCRCRGKCHHRTPLHYRRAQSPSRAEVRPKDRHYRTAAIV
jgi:hypothetical protein